MATRLDYRNVAGRCKKENRFEGGKPYEFAIRREIRKRHTTAKLFKLSKTTKQWEIGELEQLVERREAFILGLHDALRSGY